MLTRMPPAATPWWVVVSIDLVIRVGFPSAVAGFVLLRLEARLQELTLAVQALAMLVHAGTR